MTTTFECTGPEKDSLVTAMAAILINDCAGEVNADAINAVIKVSIPIRNIHNCV